MDLVLAVVGLALLFKAGDMLVEGSVAAGVKFRIPPILIGLTIVAFGTSAPELFVTVQASIQGATGIAVGNVVGSNIANVLLVVGLPALIGPMSDHSETTQRNYLIMLGVTVVTILFCLNGSLSWWTGVLLLSALALFLIYTYVSARQGADVSFDEVEEADAQMRAVKMVALMIGGVLGLVIGAHLAVVGARNVALSLGVSEGAIGLTLIALGTSLPELATTIMAALRNRADVAIGNVIGSNVFNLLAILGVASLLDPITIPDEFLNVNLWVMLASALVLAPFIYLKRFEASARALVGGAFVAAYVLYVAVVLSPQQAEATGESVGASAPLLGASAPLAAR